jgi:aspartate carbamoyltransferase regulatory subunit
LGLLWETAIINAIKIIEMMQAFNLPKYKLPFAIGLVRKSPKVAPDGIVKIKAIQKKVLSG